MKQAHNNLARGGRCYATLETASPRSRTAPSRPPQKNGGKKHLSNSSSRSSSESLVRPLNKPTRAHTHTHRYTLFFTLHNVFFVSHYCCLAGSLSLPLSPPSHTLLAAVLVQFLLVSFLCCVSSFLLASTVNVCCSSCIALHTYFSLYLPLRSPAPFACYGLLLSGNICLGAFLCTHISRIVSAHAGYLCWTCFLISRFLF